MTRAVRALDHASDAAACDAIVRGLPDWFANEDGLREQAELVRTGDGLVVVEDGAVVGFLTYARLNARTAEVTWMAVRADRRRRGIGAVMIEELTARLSREGMRMLVVKTLSDREDPGTEYAQTRAFYLRCGFVPVAELDIWGPENPCQLLSKPVPVKAPSFGPDT